MIYKTATGKSGGRFRNIISLPLKSMTTMKSKKLIKKLKKSDKAIRLMDSLSLFGKTIASSNLKDETTVIIPIRLR